MRVPRAALVMKATARGTGKGSERGSGRPAFSVRPANAETLVTGGVLSKKVTAGVKVVAGSAAARITVLLVRLGGPKRPKRACLGAVLANQALGTKE
jgi:hypothetical protein